MTDKILLTIANKGKITTTTGFHGYDMCLNPYVGCQFGCMYCYVRFFVKDPQKPWGEFVRRREHMTTRLPKEIPALAGQRIVLGTMTDPYQPEERKHRITRTALGILAKGNLSKVGIFTRSPIVLDDIELIASLPRARVHFSITPFNRDVMMKIEQIPIQTKARWATIRKLKQAGIRIHVNVAPAIPIVSDPLITDFCKQIADIGVDEFFVDPMQTYSESFTALGQALQGNSDWPAIHAIMTDKAKYAAWKETFRIAWAEAWDKVGKPKSTLAIWCDHVHRVWNDMATGQKLDRDVYGDNT